VSALAASCSQLAAGLTSGHAAVLDDRTGAAVAFWKGHDAGITTLASIDTHHLLTASQVETRAAHSGMPVQVHDSMRRSGACSQAVGC